MKECLVFDIDEALTQVCNDVFLVLYYLCQNNLDYDILNNNV
jgi:hypothetical protein